MSCDFNRTEKITVILIVGSVMAIASIKKAACPPNFVLLLIIECQIFLSEKYNI